MRYLIGHNLAILFCKAPNGALVSVPIDKQDLPAVLAAGEWRVYNVSTHRGGSHFYCVNTSRRARREGHAYLHRLIAGKDAREIDHRNRRGTDNRRENLHIATHSENMLNRRDFAHKLDRQSNGQFAGVTA